jgi:hypothetical protein
VLAIFFQKEKEIAPIDQVQYQVWYLTVVFGIL